MNYIDPFLSQKGFGLYAAYGINGLIGIRWGSSLMSKDERPDMKDFLHGPIIGFVKSTLNNTNGKMRRTMVYVRVEFSSQYEAVYYMLGVCSSPKIFER